MNKHSYIYAILKYIILAPALFAFMAVSGQTQYPQTYFRSPVGYSFTLSGSYGEVRKNHFHSGIDIRTDGVIGKPVYAAADGYVSRINISPYGFGKALYIQHPNGYTTIYGHLNAYAGEIASWARNQQYKNESFPLDTEVPKDLLKVKKGDIIAWSGNSGASGGPHLHFEIRDGATQEPMDPLAFGIKLADRTDPRITWIRIIPWGFNSMVNFTEKPAMLSVSYVSGKAVVKQADTVMVSGNIIFGIEAFDFQDAASMKIAIKAVKLYVDDTKVFGQRIDRFPFAETRYVNAILDYPLYMATKQRVMRSYIAQNNILDIFDADVSNRGIVNFTDNKVHKVKYVVSDVFGNETQATFYVKSTPPANVRGRTSPELNAKGKYMFCTEDNTWEADGAKFFIPKGALYDDLDFLSSVTGPVMGSFSGLYHLHNLTVPIQSNCDLTIKAQHLPEKLQSKALIVKVDGGSRFTSAGGTYADGYVTAKIREFGNYTIMADTAAPVIKPINIYHNKNISKQKIISLKISDNLAGIKAYRGTLNGQWILMDYDAKRDMLTYKYDDRIKPGKNQFRLVVTDNVGNRAEYNATLIR
jgi:hypothetical protein